MSSGGRTRLADGDDAVAPAPSFRVDLLASQRSAYRQWVASLLYSAQVRQTLIAPGAIVVVIFAAYIGLGLQVRTAEAQLTDARAQYRVLLRSEAEARVRVESYERLRLVATELFRLRRSIVDRAQEIVGIGNVVYTHHLDLTSISDATAQRGSGPPGSGAPTGASDAYWNLAGEAANSSATATCFVNVAAALADFIHVKNIVTALPSENRDRLRANVCQYSVRLGRGTSK